MIELDIVIVVVDYFFNHGDLYSHMLLICDFFVFVRIQTFQLLSEFKLLALHTVNVFFLILELPAFIFNPVLPVVEFVHNSGYFLVPVVDLVFDVSALVLHLVVLVLVLVVFLVPVTTVVGRCLNAISHLAITKNLNYSLTQLQAFVLLPL